MKVYSPSSTATWMRCPMMRALGQEGWIGKYAAKKDYAATLGQGFAAGVAIYNNIRFEHEQGGAKLPPRDATARASIIEACVESAKRLMDERLKEMQDIGLIMDDSDGYVDKLAGRCTKAVSTYIATDPIPDSWRVVAAEKDFGVAYGGARADLVVRDETGLAVVDYKSKLTLKAEYRHKTISEYGNSHQMLHYAWAGGETYGEPIHKYYIGLAVLEPRWAFDLVPYPVHPESLATWLKASQRAWMDMEAEEVGDKVPWMAADHSDRFGMCQYYKACFVHHYDPNLMKQDYLQVERIKQ